MSGCARFHRESSSGTYWAQLPSAMLCLFVAAAGEGSCWGRQLGQTAGVDSWGRQLGRLLGRLLGQLLGRLLGCFGRRCLWPMDMGVAPAHLCTGRCSCLGTGHPKGAPKGMQRVKGREGEPVGC